MTDIDTSSVARAVIVGASVTGNSVAGTDAVSNQVLSTAGSL